MDRLSGEVKTNRKTGVVHSREVPAWCICAEEPVTHYTTPHCRPTTMRRKSTPTRPLLGAIHQCTASAIAIHQSIHGLRCTIGHWVVIAIIIDLSRTQISELQPPTVNHSKSKSAPLLIENRPHTQRHTRTATDLSLAVQCT